MHEEEKKPNVLPSMLLLASPEFPARMGIGYWQAAGAKGAPPVRGEGKLPWPGDYIDTRWDEEERLLVAALLDSAPVLTRWRGPSTCRICGCFNGSAALGYADGPIWPEGFGHYVREHAVRPSASFVNWLKRKHYTAPHTSIP